MLVYGFPFFFQHSASYFCYVKCCWRLLFIPSVLAMPIKIMDFVWTENLWSKQHLYAKAFVYRKLYVSIVVSFSFSFIHFCPFSVSKFLDFEKCLNICMLVLLHSDDYWDREQLNSPFFVVRLETLSIYARTHTEIDSFIHQSGNFPTEKADQNHIIVQIVYHSLWHHGHGRHSVRTICIGYYSICALIKSI